MSSNGDRDIVSGIVIAYSVLCFILGLCGNLLVLCVYLTKQSRSSTNILIIALGIGDLLLCTMRLLDTFTNHGREYFSAVSKVNDMILFASGFITTAIAFDRYDAICRPNRRFMSPARAKVLSVVCQGLGVVVIAPTLFDTLVNGSTALCLFLNCTAAFLFSACLVTVVVLYAKISLALRRRVKVGISWRLQQQPRGQEQSATTGNQLALPTSDGLERSSAKAVIRQFPSPLIRVLVYAEQAGQQAGPFLSQSSSTSQPTNGPFGSFASRTTKMLLLSTGVFFVTWIPFIIHRTWVVSSFCLAGGDVGVLTESIVYTLLSSIVFMNCVLNPFVYSIANTTFRQDSKVVFLKLRSKMRQACACKCTQEHTRATDGKDAT